MNEEQFVAMIRADDAERAAAKAKAAVKAKAAPPPKPDQPHGR